MNWSWMPPLLSGTVQMTGEGAPAAGCRRGLDAQAAEGGPLATPVAHLAHASVEDLTKDGFFFAGTPDEVAEQIAAFNEGVGGFGHFLAMVQGGTMGYELTAASMELLAADVMPQLQ